MYDDRGLEFRFWLAPSIGTRVSGDLSHLSHDCNYDHDHDHNHDHDDDTTTTMTTNIVTTWQVSATDGVM